MYNIMQKRRQYLVSEISECRRKLSGAPSGNLVCSRNGGYVKWYVHDKNGTNYLPKRERNLAEALAIKRVEEKRLNLLIKELKSVDDYLSTCVSDEELLNIFYTEAIPDISLFPLLSKYKDDEMNWMKESFSNCTFYPENLILKCLSGNRVRSKSEMIIDTELYNLGIPFRYECELIIGGKVFFPDFTIFKSRTKEIRYWEHMGMMDNPEYIHRNCKKMEDYSLNGIYPGVNLYITYETDETPIDISKIHSTALEIKEWIDS